MLLSDIFQRPERRLVLDIGIVSLTALTPSLCTAEQNVQNV